MVGMVIVSHSKKIAQGVRDIVLQMASNVPVAIAGGTKDERIGTDVDSILDGINKVYSDDGVIILFDMGSALMNAEMAVDFLSKEKRSNVRIVDTALVEGAVTAAVEIGMGKSLMEVEQIVEEMKLGKKA